MKIYFCWSLYINNINFKRLEINVKQFEPKIALKAGIDGLKIIKKLIFKSRELLKINGKLIMEIGHKQRNQSLKILKNFGFYINKISKDLSGKDRCIVSTKL